MPPNILLTAYKFSKEERKEIYSSYLEKRFRKIFLRTIYRNVQQDLYSLEINRFIYALEYDIKKFNKTNVPNHIENYNQFDQNFFITLRTILLEDYSNEYNIFGRQVRWFLDVNEDGYDLRREYI